MNGDDGNMFSRQNHRKFHLTCTSQDLSPSCLYEGLNLTRNELHVPRTTNVTLFDMYIRLTSSNWNELIIIIIDSESYRFEFISITKLNLFDEHFQHLLVSNTKFVYIVLGSETHIHEFRCILFLRRFFQLVSYLNWFFFCKWQCNSIFWMGKPNSGTKYLKLLLKWAIQ